MRKHLCCARRVKPQVTASVSPSDSSKDRRMLLGGQQFTYCLTRFALKWIAEWDSMLLSVTMVKSMVSPFTVPL